MTTILQKIPGAINALQLALKSAVQPQSVCSLNAITANPLGENSGGDQRNAVDPIGQSLTYPIGICLLNAITANPLRALPFALLFGKDQPDKK